VESAATDGKQDPIIYPPKTMLRREEAKPPEEVGAGIPELISSKPSSKFRPSKALKHVCGYHKDA
jgi:hypothetical protein